MTQNLDYPLDYTRGSTRTSSQSAKEAAKAFDRVEPSEQGINSAVDRLGDISGQVKKMVEDLPTMLDRSLKDQPMGTLAAGALIGFVLGAIWKR